MGEPAIRHKQRHTWADYQTWPHDQRWEIIGGDALAMSPSPSFRHQCVQTQLCAAMSPFFRKRPCRLLTAPMDVKLSEEDVVQPDLLVVCDPTRIQRTHIEGAPALAVEIISPRSVMTDRYRKIQLYARAGVPEYWIVTPHQPLVEIFVLNNGEYTLRALFTREDSLVSPSFPGLTFPLADVFDFPPEPGDEPPMIAAEPGPRYTTP